MIVSLVTNDLLPFEHTIFSQILTGWDWGRRWSDWQAGVKQ